MGLIKSFQIIVRELLKVKKGGNSFVWDMKYPELKELKYGTLGADFRCKSSP